MSARVYVTIDDSPSSGTDALFKYLRKEKIPAILFCIGERLENNPGPVIRAIEDGFVIGNHGYHHKPAAQLGMDALLDGIERTEELIEAAYVEARVQRPGYYFRFPYIDRGDGDRIERHFEDFIAAVNENVPVRLHPDAAGRKTVEQIQDVLKNCGFAQPFKHVNHPLYRVEEISGAADCLFTFSSGDWMLTGRHKGKWPYNSVDDLKARMNNDPYLFKDGMTSVALFHDQDGLTDVTTGLIGHMKARGVSFV